MIEAFRAGTEANYNAPCRQKSIDAISVDDAPPNTLIATGDLHDNPMNFAKLVRRAGLDANPTNPPAHLTLHELIHSDRLVNGADFSYRVLAQIALLKARHPGLVHLLLGNHELAQFNNSQIIKDGVLCIKAFAAGVEFVFGGDSDAVLDSIKAFIRSMPIALRVHTSHGDLLCAHSVPSAAAMARFDATILSRDLTEDDYQPKTGSCHLMTWGRGYDAEGLEDLTERWGVSFFILGHEKADNGSLFVPPNALVLASDHERGVCLPIDLTNPPGPEEATRLVVPLAELP